MARKFKTLLCLWSVLMIAGPSVFAQEINTEQQQTPKTTETTPSPAIAMVTERMKSLAGSLNGMPQIPVLNQSVSIPALSVNFQQPSDREKSKVKGK